MNLIAEQAKEKVGMPDDWHWYSMRVLGIEYGGKAECYEIKGAVAPLFIQGSRKGQHNWKRKDKTTDRTVYVTVESHDEWLKEWERKTGKCSCCAGEGRVLKRWNHVTGSEYQPCRKCNATGRAGYRESAV